MGIPPAARTIATTYHKVASVSITWRMGDVGKPHMHMVQRDECGNGEDVSFRQNSTHMRVFRCGLVGVGRVAHRGVVALNIDFQGRNKSRKHMSALWRVCPPREVCAQRSLKLTGTPCRGPRMWPVEANSSSSALASARACEKKTGINVSADDCP